MISFKYGGVSVNIGFSFLVFNALIFLIRDSSLIIAFYATCAIHEAGHITALRLTGGRVGNILFSGAGIRIDTRKNCTFPLRSSLFVLAAGPAANLMVYAVSRAYGGAFTILNLSAALYNMLPYRSLDGGAMIAMLTLGTVHERNAELILAIVKLLMIAAAFAVMMKYGRAAMPLLIVTIGLFIGDLRAVSP